MKYCDIQETPEFQYTVDNIRDEFGPDAEHIAYKNFVENGGSFSSPDKIIEKEKKEYFSPVFDKQSKKVWEVLDYLQRARLLSQKVVDWSADVIYRQAAEMKALNKKDEGYKISDNDVILSVPRIYTEKTAAENTQFDMSNFGGEKDPRAFEELNRFLDENDIDFIKTFEYKNSYIVTINKDIYYKALRERRVANNRKTMFYREVYPQTETLLDLNNAYTESFTKSENDDVISLEIAKQYAKGLSQQLGVDYDFVTAKEAAELTKDTLNPYNGEKAFFVGGKVYFTGNSFKKDTLFHEFSHPLVRAIAISNKKLFDKLYNDLALTLEGKAVIENVQQLYPELNTDEDLFKEESIVRALTKDAQLQDEKLKEVSGFKKVISNILYQLKQLLRNVFGKKADVSKLKSDTSIAELANMLRTGEQFDLDVQEITSENSVAYEREFNKQLNDLTQANLDKQEIEDLTNKYFNLVSKQLVQLTKDEKYPELLEIVKNKYKAGELQKMKQNLKPYQTLIQQDAKKMADETELTRQRAIAVINSLNNLNNMMGKIYSDLQEIVKDINDPANVQRAMYYQNTLNYWNEFVTTATTTLERENVKLPMVNNITANIRRSNDLLNKFYEKATADVLWSQLSGSADNINKKWDERIKDLEKRNAPANVIAQAKKQATEEKISPDNIKKALKGELKDLNFANAYLEGYGYSPDPVVGGLAAFVKDSMTEVEAAAQKNVNQQAEELSPLLKENNYNPNKAGQLGIDLGQKEKVGRINHETGEFEEVEIWRFMNEFSGADVIRDRYLFRIQEASKKYQETKTEEDAQKLADIQAEWEQHRRDFFNQEYTEAFYKAFDLFKKDEIGKQAKGMMDNLYDQINQLQNTIATAEDEIYLSEQIDAVRREIKQMSSLTNVFGEKKNGIDLQIAERIQQFNELSKDIYYSEEIPGAFENALRNYEQKLSDEGKGPGTEAFDRLRSQWLEKNTRVVIDEEFWETLGDVNARIKGILDTLPNDLKIKLEIEESYQEIKNILTGNKDESGQPVGGEMTEESQKKIKAAQDRILKAQEFLNRTNGLTPSEKVLLESIFSRIDAKQATEADHINLRRLLDKQDVIGLDKVKRAALRGLYSKLEDLRQREPTDSYVETINAFLREMGDKNPLFTKINSNEISKANAFVILNDEILEELFAVSPAFEKWFKINHLRKPSIDQETGQEIERWEKTYAWNVIRPKDPKYYKKTTLTDKDGNVVEEILGLPSMKYFKRLVKDEYLTKKVIGETIDNAGRWLPKTLNQGTKDDRYINKDYFTLRQRDPARYRLLEKMKQIHLRNQEGLNKKGKLYLDYPRYRKQTIERLQSENPVKRVAQRVKDFWVNVKDKWDQGFNYQDELQLVKMDLLDDETTGIPISGLSNLDINEISTDITYGMMRYMLSGERQKKLIEIAPVAKAIQNVVNNKANFPFAQKNIENRSVINMGKKKDKYLRAQAVNNFIEKNFEGKVNAGWGADNATAQNFSNLLFKQASFSYLALNVPSAIKNALSAKFQGLIESVAGKYMSTADFIAAEKWATQSTFKISAEIYKKGAKGLDVQLIELFDPERDRFKYGIGESLSRTPGKDTMLALERLNDFRKWTQLQATLQIFGGIMKHNKVEQNGKSIPYLEAWEIVDGRIQLKKGIDPSWGITYTEDGKQIIGDKFKQKKNEIQRVIDNLNGAMGREDRPEADRYLLFRYLSFFRRWMTSMFTNRFAYSGDLLKGTARGRYDYQLGDTKEGFYITNLKLMYRTFRTMGKYIPFASAEEKAAFLRLGTELGTLILMGTLLPALFGWDPDDEDRYKKLRANSDALPFFYVEDDPHRDFDLGGWLSNHALLMLMQTRGENDQFLPFPGLGINDYKQWLDIKSMVFGPTLKTYADIAQDVGYLVTGDDKAYYQKDVGAYKWQQQDEAKIWNHIAKAIGVTGSSIDPAVAIKNFQNVQNR